MGAPRTSLRRCLKQGYFTTVRALQTQPHSPKLHATAAVAGLCRVMLVSMSLTAGMDGLSTTRVHVAFKIARVRIGDFQEFLVTRSRL